METRRHGIVDPAAVKIREARVWQMTYQVGTVEGDDGLFIKAAFALGGVGPSCN